MSRIDYQHVHARLNQAAGTLVVVHTDRGPDTQSPQLVHASMGKPLHHVDVADRDDSGQAICIVNQQQLLDFFSRQNSLSFLKRHSSPRRNEVILGHYLADRLLAVLQKPQVAAGKNSDQLVASVGDREAADILQLHQLLRPADRVVRPQRDGIGDNAVG